MNPNLLSHIGPRVRFLLFWAACGASAFAAGESSVSPSLLSPDGSLGITVSDAGGLAYRVELDKKPVLSDSPLGLQFKDGARIGPHARIVKTTRGSHDASWTNRFGKQRTVRDHYNEMKLELAEEGTPVRRFGLTVRAYNDGVAFRYDLPQESGLDRFTLTADDTRFLFPSECRAWAGDNTKYECTFPAITLGKLSDKKKSLPLVVETPAAYVAVAEADVREWSGSSLVAAGGGALGARADLIAPVVSQTPCMSPWHVLMVGRTAGDMTVSTILLNLATPSRIADDSWVKPGIMAWDPWWTGLNPYWDQYKGVHARGNTQADKDYIDLAASMGWPYMLVDWYWYDQGSKDPETAIKPQPHIDIPALLAYAKSKGVGLFFWANSKNVPSIGADKLFDTYAKWGAVGVKIDFFHDNGSQATLRWQEELLACAAKHRLMMDFHGTYTPTGLSRTWPNLITQEGVLGLEYNKLGRSFTPEHMITLPFTRGLLGPADTTPGGFVNRTVAEFQVNATPCQVMGSRARHLAFTMLMDSPLLCLADSPKNYLGQPGLEFYRNLPTTWDETKVLSSEMSGHLAQARRSAQSWWLAAMNNDKPLALKLPLAFLGQGKYVIRSFADTEQSGIHPTEISETKRTVTCADILDVNMVTAGGYVAVLAPAR